jgi:hypothetical protein
VRPATRRIFVCSLACSFLLQAQDEFFSGTIVEVDSQKITVSRTVLGKDSGTRTFQITPQTRIEGEPRAKARVTVRFVSDEQGDRAVHIIVRPPSGKKN